MQLIFGDAEGLGKRKQTRREIFLGEMEQAISWKSLLTLIEPYYPRSGRRGRPSYALATMLRIHLLEQWYALSDPGMEEALHEIASMRLFARLSWLDTIPDETTALNFVDVKCTAANLGDGPPTHELLHGKEGCVLGAAATPVRTNVRNWRTTRRPSSLPRSVRSAGDKEQWPPPLSRALGELQSQHAREGRASFRVIKRQFGYAKCAIGDWPRTPRRC